MRFYARILEQQDKPGTDIEGTGPKHPGHIGWQSQLIFEAFAVLDRVANTFGIPAATLLLCFGAVWFFGDAKTKNDFVRELLFRDVTHTPWLSLFFAILIVVSAVGAWRATVRRRALESTEMRRLASERTRLQEKLLEASVSHSAPPGQDEASS